MRSQVHPVKSYPILRRPDFDCVGSKWLDTICFTPTDRVSLFHRKTARAASCMRAGPSDFRRRSRSVVRPGGDVGERLNEAQAKYGRILAEGRAGTKYQSRENFSFWQLLSIIFILLSAQWQLQGVWSVT